MSDLAHVPIVDVWRRLPGSGPLKHGRGRAFWRDGDGLNIDIEPTKNLWCDRARGNAGGGVLRLVEVALGTDRRGALAWLENEGLIEPREITRAERAKYAQRRGRAREMARLASLWLRERLVELDDEKRSALDPFDPWALQAAASQHYRLSTLDEAGVMRDWLAARAAEPVTTRERERRGEKWERACASVVGLVVSRLAEVRDVA